MDHAEVVSGCGGGYVAPVCSVCMVEQRERYSHVWYDGKQYCPEHDPERRHVPRAVLVRALLDVRGELNDRERGDYDFEARCMGIIDAALAGGDE